MEHSKRIEKMQSSPIRRLIPYAEQAKEMGKEVLHLNIGQPDIETPKAFFKAIEKNAGKVIPYSQNTMKDGIAPSKPRRSSSQTGAVKPSSSPWEP